ncbi:LysR family transcriptional regulator [Shimia sp. W99]
MVHFSLRQLLYLSEVARRGGIAQAARQMNVSTAAVAAAIDKLEAILGLTLFDRFPAQGMRLTRAGEEFAAQAAVLLEQAEALDRRARDLAEGRAGALYVGTHFALAHRYVLPAVLAFRAKYPDVRVHVKEGDFPDLVDALDTGAVDALVVFDQGFHSQKHVVEPLKDLPPLVLVAAEHPLGHQDEISLADLSQCPYVEITTPGPGPSYLQMLQAAGVHPDVPFSTQSRELAQAYVGKGLGVTLVGFPPMQDRTIEGDPVVVRPIREDIGLFRAVIVRSGHVAPSPLLVQFLAMCRAQG